MRRSLAFALVLLGTSTVRPTTADAAPDAGPTPVAIPEGVPVTLDGLTRPDEWSDAARCPTSAGGPELRTQRHRATWLLALGTAVPWPANGHFTLYARAGAEDGSILAKGTVWIDVEPREHNRPHALVRVRDDAGAAWNEVQGQVVARFSGVDRQAAVELAIPATLLGIASPTPPPLRWLAIVTSPESVPHYRTFPQQIDLAGKDPKALGPDLASTARWAVTTAWPHADGPGAYSAAEWKAFVDADAELYRLGKTAYDVGLGLDGENADGTTTERAKADRSVETAVIEGFRAIGAREALTPADLRLYARGLLELNRAPEAAALLEGMTLGRRGEGDPDDYAALARAALAAERFEEAAKAYEALADRVSPKIAPGFRGTAAWVRAVATDFAAEQKARDEDAAKDDLPVARLRTSKGDVVVRLLEDDVPEAVAQFVHLAEEAKAEDGTPFYANTLFHKAVAGYLVQGGDPDSRKGCAAAGKGGSAWSVPPQTNARHRLYRGAVAFALNGEAGYRSQFFVMTGPKPDLHKGGMPVFGTVISGMDVVDRLEVCDRLLGVEILKKRPHPYVPTKPK